MTSLREKFARALDDNLHTRQWHNLIDWLIVFMILLSTAEIFMSTFDVSPAFRCVLLWIDIATLVFFTIEVSLRIWVAPDINPRYKGFKGRLRYCTSFYGVIDLLSTVPFYLQWLMPLPVAAFKLLRTARVVRIFRITRYTKSFRLLTEAFAAKRHELFVSLQFLIIITIILSLVLFFFEHEKQPEVYDNGFVSVIWAFAQYIGDPGQFADTPPATVGGRIIACIVGLLGIAIVAVPAGIIGAGFTEAIEDDKKLQTIIKDAANLRNGFERKLDRPTGYQVVPPFISVMTLKAKLGMKDDCLMEAIEHGPGYRLVNLASTIPAEKTPTDRLAVEHFPTNRPYGCMIDRNSPVTIISPASVIDAGIGNFAFYVALIGGFNLISRETGDKAPYRSFYVYDSEDSVEYLKEYNSDLHRLMDRPRAWGVTLLVSSGALEPEYPTHVHLNIGGAKGDRRMGGDGLFVNDTETYSRFYKDLSERLKSRLGIATDHQEYHSTVSPRHFVRKTGLDKSANNIVIRLEWNKILWDPRRMVLARELAGVISLDLAGKEVPDNREVLGRKAIGYEGYGVETEAMGRT